MTKKKKNNWIGFLLILIIWAIVHSIAGFTEKSKNTDSPKSQVETTQKTIKKSSEDLTWFAKFQCEKEIKARIPSAKVHFRQDNYINGNSYTVYGTIDGQNAFRAMVRQNFGCEIIIDQENDKFWIKDLLIE